MRFFTSVFINRFTRLLGASVLVAFLLPVVSIAQSPTPVDLRSATNFAILAYSTITNTGQTVVTGDMGLSPLTAVTGFPPGICVGTQHVADLAAANAKLDLSTAYDDAAGRTVNPIGKNAANLGGTTLVAGLYKSTSTLSITGSDLTLDGGGDANAVWIFQVASDFDMGNALHIVLINGANTRNIFWQVAGHANIGTTSVFSGTIMAYAFVTFQTGAVLNGRAMSKTEAVNLDGNAVTLPAPAPANTVIFSTVSRNINVDSTHIDSLKWTLITISNTGNAPLTISASTSTNPVFTSHLSATTIAAGGSIIDSIEFLPTTVGADSAKLIFSSNATTSPDTIGVRGKGFKDTVIVVAKTAILATDSRNVNCGVTTVGVATWTMITLSNTGTDTLRISAATSANADFSSHLSAMIIAPGESIIDTIKFLPTSAGVTQAKLIFVSNSTTSPDTIGVYGNAVSGTNAAILAVSARDVDCGTTLIGTHSLGIFTIGNRGTDTLRIASSTSTSTVFSSRLSGILIPPGESVEMDSITFTPTTVGMAFGQIVLISNSVTSPDTILVRGNGTTPSAVNDGTSATSFALGEIYPNPLSDAGRLTVRLQSGERIINAGLYDMLGRELQNWTSRIGGNGALSLHLGFYPNGEYVVRLLSSTRMQILPLMIVK